jgi:hypothetical protein
MAADETRSGNGLGEGGVITDPEKDQRSRREPVVPEDRNLSLPKPVLTLAAAADTTKEERMFRYGTAADVDRIESLTLEDYAVDLSKVQIPEGRLTDAELHALVRQIVDMLNEAPEVRDGR